MKSFLKIFRDSELSLLASSLTFFSILAIVPFLAVSLSMIHIFGGLERMIESRINDVIGFLTVGSGDQIASQLEGAIGGANFQAVGFVSYFILVFTVLRLLNVVDQAVQRIWHARKKAESY